MPSPWSARPHGPTRWDATGEGVVDGRDLRLVAENLGEWLLWLFHLPGDLLLWGLTWPSFHLVADAFRIAPSFYGGLASTIWSIAFWAAALTIARWLFRRVAEG